MTTPHPAVYAAIAAVTLALAGLLFIAVRTVVLVAADALTGGKS